MANENQVTLEFILKAQQAIQEAKTFQTSIEKITDATNELKSASILLASAQQKEAQAVQSGDKQAIASARERVEILQKAQEQAVKALEQETKAYERLIEAEKKAAQQQASNDAGKATSSLGGIKDISKLTEALANPAAAVGLLIEKFQELSKESQEAIKKIGEKFSEFIIGLSEGKISVNDFIEGIKGSVSELGDSFGLVGTAAAEFNNILLSGFQALSNITLEVAEEQKAFRGLTQTLGLTTETLKTYEQALQQAGLPTSNLRLILLGVSQSLEKLNQEEPRASAAFKRLKLSAEDFVGLNADEKFKLVLDRIRELNAVNKEAAADVAGVVAGSKRYVEQLDLIARNAETNRQSIRDYGAALSDVGDKNVLALGRALTDLDNLFTGVKNTIAEKFAPELTRLAEQAKLVLTSLKADPSIIAFFDALLGAVVVITRALGFLLLSAEGAVLALIKIKDTIPGVKELVRIFDLLHGTTDQNAKALDEFTKKQEEAKHAEEEHEKTLKQLRRAFQDLNDTAKNLNENAKAGSEERIRIFQEEAEAGRLTTVEAAGLILKERQDLSKKLIDNAVQQLIETQKLAEKDLNFLKEVESARANLAKVETEAAKANSAAQKDLRDATSKEITDQAERDKNERIAKNKEAINAINQQENEGKKSHKEAADERNQITRNEILKEIETNKSLSEDLRLNSKARGEARKEVSKLTVDLANQDLKAEKEANAAKRKDDKDTADAKKKSQDEEAKSLDSSIKTRSALTKAATEEEKQGIQEIVEKFSNGQLTKEEALRRAYQLELQLIGQSLANQLASLSDLTTQKSLGKDVDDKIIAANEEITKLQRDQLALQKALKGEIDGTSEAVKKVADSFKDTDGAASKSTGSVKDTGKAVDDLNSAMQKTAGKILSIKQNFDASTASVEELKQQVIDLRADADSIRFSNILAFPGQQAVAKSFEETAEALEKILGERIGKANLEAFKQREAAELAERRKGAEQALDIVKDFEDEANQIREDSLEKRKDLKQQIIDNATQEATEVAQIKIDNQKELDEFDQEQKDRELERADQQHESLLEKEASFQANLAETKNKAAEEQLDKERDAILKRADLESQIADLIASKKGAKPDEIAKIEAKIKELQGQIKGVDEAEKSRTEREKKRQDEIAKAQQEASEKIKGAKSADEVTQIEKELAIQLDGINEKFANEEKFEADLAKLKDKASKETLDALRKNFEAQQALVDKSVNDRIAAEQRQADLAEQARKKAADKEKADIETRRSDLLAAQAKELSDRATAFEEKQKQLEAALTKEREDYKKHIDELRTKTAESLAEIAKSFTDGGAAAEKFFKDFATNAGLTGKAIDDILKKLKAFKDQAASDSQQTDSASGTPSSGNVSTPSTSSSSPFSSPGSNPNNTAGQIGTPSAPPAPSGKGIVEQPKSDKQGNQPTGVAKGQPKTGQQSPGDASPSSASDANSFRKSVIDLRKNFEKNVEGNTRKDGSLIRNKKTDPIIQKLYENLTSILKSYFTSAGLDLSKVGASETNFLFSSITELRNNTYKQAIDKIVELVESQRKQEDTSKGDGKTDTNNVSTSDPGSSGLSGAGAGSGDGDKGNDGFGDKGKPTAPGAPQPSSEPKNQVALARERENFSEIEEKNAETGAGLTGPNFPGAPDNPPSSDDESESGVDPSSTTPPSDPTNQPSKPSSNITRRSDNFDGNRSVAGDSQPITATATIEKFINIENQTVIVNPSGATDKQEITKEMANSMIDAIIPLIPDRRDLVSILNAELDAKNTTDFASRNPLRAYKV